MTTTAYQGIALLAMFAAMVLLSWGTTQDLTIVTASGGVLLALSAATLTVLRFANPEGDDED